MKLNLGCGSTYLEGFVNCDRMDSVKKDKKLDLDVYPWDFKDNSIEHVNCTFVLEHVLDPVRFMEEVYRILVPNGTAFIVVPYWNNYMSYGHLDHRYHFSEYAFDYFNEPTKFEHENMSFKAETKVTFNPAGKLLKMFLPKNFYHYVPNVAETVEATLTKVKP